MSFDTGRTVCFTDAVSNTASSVSYGDSVLAADIPEASAELFFVRLKNLKTAEVRSTASIAPAMVHKIT